MWNARYSSKVRSWMGSFAHIRAAGFILNSVRGRFTHTLCATTLRLNAQAKAPAWQRRINVV